MSKKRQTLICSLLFIAVVLLGVMVLEVGRAKTVSGSPGGARSTEIGNAETLMLLTQTSHPAFTFTASRTATRDGGPARLLSTLQRFQRSDGLFKVVFTLYAPEGATERVETQFGLIGIGVFRVDESRRRLVFTWPQVDERPENVERVLREHPLFAREESLQGVNAIVWRHAGSLGTEFTEEYRAPSLGGLQIKTVKVTRRGRETLEPTALQMGEPAQNVFTEFFVYSVDYSSFERGVLDADGRGAPEVAQLMREALARMRQIRP